MLLTSYGRNNKYQRVTKGTSYLLCALLLAPGLAMSDGSPWPVAIQDQASVLTQQALVIPVIANDIGEKLEIIEVNTTTTSLGSASVSDDKLSIIYQSANGFTGEDTFWYAFKDNQGRTNAAKVTVIVTDGPAKPIEWPTAGSESPEVEFNQPINIAVLDNDQGVGLKITDVNTTTVRLGTASISEDGLSIRYTPPEGFSGNDEFWYVFTDNWGRTNAGKVTPNVLPQYNNTPWPTAISDHASTISTRSILIPALDNDEGLGLKLKEVNTTTTGLGNASIRNGYIRYVPAKNFEGQDSFWYAFEDKYGRTNSTQVFVDVTRNTQLSSIAFCDKNYFTDGTLENTQVLSDVVDSQSKALYTRPDLEDFTSPAGTFAVVGDRQYMIETNGSEKSLTVTKNGESTTLRTFALEDEVYGVGVRDNTLYFAVKPIDQPEHPESSLYTTQYGTSHRLFAHDSHTLVTLDSYRLRSGGIRMMANADSTLFTYVGLGKDDNNRDIGQHRNYYYYQYIQLNPENHKAVYLGEHSKSSRRTATRSTTKRLAVLSYNQHLIASLEGTYTRQGRSSIASALSASQNSPTDFQYGLLGKAIISNDRLLLTTEPHSNYASWDDPTNTDFPAKLYSFDTQTGKFIELATCE